VRSHEPCDDVGTALVDLPPVTACVGVLALGSLAGRGLSVGWTRRAEVVWRVRVSRVVEEGRREGRRLRGRVSGVSIVSGRDGVVMAAEVFRDGGCRC